jgi:hypothetical protein
MSQQQGGSPWGQQEEDSDNTVRVASVVAGTILVTAVAGYLFRRSRQKEHLPAVGRAEEVLEQARDAVSGFDLDAGREFLMKQILPELRPVLLTTLEELEDVAEQVFKEAKKAIKNM